MQLCSNDCIHLYQIFTQGNKYKMQEVHISNHIIIVNVYYQSTGNSDFYIELVIASHPVKASLRYTRCLSMASSCDMSVLISRNVSAANSRAPSLPYRSFYSSPFYYLLICLKLLGWWQKNVCSDQSLR